MVQPLPPPPPLLAQVENEREPCRHLLWQQHCSHPLDSIITCGWGTRRYEMHTQHWAGRHHDERRIAHRPKNTLVVTHLSPSMHFLSCVVHTQRTKKSLIHAFSYQKKNAHSWCTNHFSVLVKHTFSLRGKGPCADMLGADATLC